MGQQSYTNALRVDVRDKCEFKTMELYKFQQAWFVFESKDSLTQITVADHIATLASAPVFDTVIVYDKNMTIVAVFSEDSADWSEIVSTPMVGSDYYLYVKSNSYFDKCDFDLCLAKLDPQGEITLLEFNDPNPCIVGDETLSILTECFTSNDSYLVWTDASGQVITSCNNNCVPDISNWPNGTYTITACLYCGLNTFPQSYMFPTDCETIAFTIANMLPPTTNILENSISACPSEICLHDQTSQASEVAWDVYYFNNGQYQNIAGDMEPSNSAYCFNFTDIGTYMIVASVVNDCGIDSDTAYVIILPPSAEFTWTNACLGSSVCFTELSNCEEYWHWNFGDGATSSQQNPCHDYAQAGNYLVTLEVAPGIIVSHTITVYSPVQPIITGDESACESSSHYQVTPAGAFSQIGWAVNSPSGWVSTVPPDEYNHSWTNGTGGVVYVETTDNNGCVAHGEMMVFDCCANPETTISFFNETLTSPQTYWHEVISVNGTLTIDANGTTSFYDCHFYMGVNAKIVITSNDIVNIGYHTKNAPQTIIEACDSLMWDGIYINDNTAKLYVYYSKIYDAKNAVVSLHGGVFEIKTSLFDKNYKHLDIRTYNGTHQGSITESVLTCSGTLLPQYPFIQGATKTRYAVSISRASNVTIGDPQSISLQNTIEKCDVGIYCLNSGVKVYNNKFQNISVPVNLPISVKKGFGIFAEKAVNYISPVSSLTVGGSGNLPGVGNFRRNVFIDVTNGVYTYQYSNIAINNNTFEIQNPTTAESKALMIYDYAHFAGTKSITNNTISNYRTGVFLNDVESMSVRDNDISDFQISQTGGYSYGIRMLGGNDVLIYGNTIENSSIYANTEGIRVSTSPLSTVQCNTIKNMGKSIHLQGTMMPFTLRQNRMENGIDALVFTNATIGTQGTSNNPQGNTWYGSFSNSQTLMNQSYGSNSQFYIKNGNHTVPAINLIVYPGDVFSPIFTQSNTWPGCVQVIPAAANPSSLYSIANNQIGYAQFEQENKWMARKQVLLAMRKDSISGDPFLSQFSLSQQNTGTAISLLVEDTLKVDPATAEILNSLMPETNFNETATKLVNNVFFEKEADTTMLPADLNISSLSADSLRWLAQQCPFEFGKAVYQARMLLSLIDTTEYMNLCEAGSAGFSDKSVQSFSTDSFNISVSPNPFANELKIEFENPEECTGFVCLMDLTGKVIATYELPEKASQFVIQTDEIAAGIYYLKVWNDNNLLKYSKIVKY